MGCPGLPLVSHWRAFVKSTGRAPPPDPVPAPWRPVVLTLQPPCSSHLSDSDIGCPRKTRFLCAWQHRWSWPLDCGRRPPSPAGPQGGGACICVSPGAGGPHLIRRWPRPHSQPYTCLPPRGSPDHPGAPATHPSPWTSNRPSSPAQGCLERLWVGETFPERTKRPEEQALCAGP